MVLSCLSVKHPFDLPPGGALYPSKLKFSIFVCLSFPSGRQHFALWAQFSAA